MENLVNLAHLIVILVNLKTFATPALMGSNLRSSTSSVKRLATVLRSVAMEKDSRLIVMMAIKEIMMDATRTVRSRKDITAKEDLLSDLAAVFHSCLIDHISQPQEQFTYSEELCRASV